MIVTNAILTVNRTACCCGMRSLVRPYVLLDFNSTPRNFTYHMLIGTTPRSEIFPSISQGLCLPAATRGACKSLTVPTGLISAVKFTPSTAMGSDGKVAATRCVPKLARSIVEKNFVICISAVLLAFDSVRTIVNENKELLRLEIRATCTWISLIQEQLLQSNNVSIENV